MSGDRGRGSRMENSQLLPALIQMKPMQTIGLWAARRTHSWWLGYMDSLPPWSVEPLSSPACHTEEWLHPTGSWLGCLAYPLKSGHVHRGGPPVAGWLGGWHTIPGGFIGKYLHKCENFITPVCLYL